MLTASSELAASSHPRRGRAGGRPSVPRAATLCGLALAVLASAGEVAAAEAPAAAPGECRKGWCEESETGTAKRICWRGSAAAEEEKDDDGEVAEESRRRGEGGGRRPTSNWLVLSCRGGAGAAGSDTGSVASYDHAIGRGRWRLGGRLPSEAEPEAEAEGEPGEAAKPRGDAGAARVGCSMPLTGSFSRENEPPRATRRPLAAAEAAAGPAPTTTPTLVVWLTERGAVLLADSAAGVNGPLLGRLVPLPSMLVAVLLVRGVRDARRRCGAASRKRGELGSLPPPSPLAQSDMASVEHPKERAGELGGLQAARGCCLQSSQDGEGWEKGREGEG